MLCIDSMHTVWERAAHSMMIWFMSLLRSDGISLMRKEMDAYGMHCMMQLLS